MSYRTRYEETRALLKSQQELTREFFIQVQTARGDLEYLKKQYADLNQKYLDVCEEYDKVANSHENGPERAEKNFQNSREVVHYAPYSPDARTTWYELEMLVTFSPATASEPTENRWVSVGASTPSDKPEMWLYLEDAKASAENLRVRMRTDVRVMEIKR